MPVTFSIRVDLDHLKPFEGPYDRMEILYRTGPYEGYKYWFDINTFMERISTKNMGANFHLNVRFQKCLRLCSTLENSVHYRKYRKFMRSRMAWTGKEVLPVYKAGKEGREGLWEMRARKNNILGRWVEGEWTFGAEFDY